MSDVIVHIWNGEAGTVQLLTSTAKVPTLVHGTFPATGLGMQLLIVAVAHLHNVLSVEEWDIDIALPSATALLKAARLFTDLPSAKVLAEALAGDRAVSEAV